MNAAVAWNRFADEWQFSLTHSDKFEAVAGYAATLLGRPGIVRRIPATSRALPTGTSASELLKLILEFLTRDHVLLQLYAHADFGGFVINCTDAVVPIDVEDRHMQLWRSGRSLRLRPSVRERITAEMIGRVIHNASDEGEQAAYGRLFHDCGRITNFAKPEEEVGRLFAYRYLNWQASLESLANRCGRSELETRCDIIRGWARRYGVAIP